METRFDYAKVESFCRKCFIQCGLKEDDASISAKVLVTADLRGIPSHGVGRLGRYIAGLQTGQMLPDAVEYILAETPCTLTVDANGAMGIPVAWRTMKQVIEKAQNCNLAMGMVGNSNHFGIAGFYAMMALEHDMLGFAFTNTAALGVPTGGRDVVFGTNPLAFAAPAEKYQAFVLDMSTTTVTRGKLEVYDRQNQPLPPGWAVDASGNPASDAGKVLQDMLERKGGGLLPLGGYKGYGLSVMVDILCGVLGGFAFGKDVFDTPESSARVGHCFGAVKLSAFCDPVKFRADMDRMIGDLKNSPKASGAKDIFYAGEPEFSAYRENLQRGIPLDAGTVEILKRISDQLNIPF